MTDTPHDPWKAAMKAAGGAEALAVRIGIARRTLFKWKRQGVPGTHVAKVSEVTGIPAARLSPDLARTFGVAA